MKRTMWGVAIALTLLGIATGILRAVYMDDLVARMEPVRPPILAALGIDDPEVPARPALVQRMDGRLAEHRAVTYTHVILGAAYLGFGLLQFSGTIRRRWLAYHRWAGRGLVVTGIVMVLAGLYFGLLMPFSGPPEAFVVGVIGALFLFSLVRGFVAIRRKDRETHRRWMTRAFAIGLGIVVVRLVSIPLELAMTVMGIGVAMRFVVTLWVGWGLSLLAAEWWLRRTRREPSAVRVPANVVVPALLLALAWTPASAQTQLATRAYGKGDHGVLLFAHGGYSSLGSWTEQAEAMASAKLRVLVVEARVAADLRAGKDPPCVYDEKCLAKDVAEGIRMLRKSGAKRVSLVGGSMGAAAVAQAAIDAPAGSIERIVLLAPAEVGAPEKIPGRKLVIASRYDSNSAGARLPGIQAQYARLTGPKKLSVIESVAHGQRLFFSGSHDDVLVEIIGFLKAK